MLPPKEVRVPRLSRLSGAANAQVGLQFLGRQRSAARLARRHVPSELTLHWHAFPPAEKVALTGNDYSQQPIQVFERAVADRVAIVGALGIVNRIPEKRSERWL